MSAIRMGTPGPPSLGTFWLRQQFWKRLGLRLEDLDGLPWREVEDYILYIQLICREEEAKNRQANAKKR